MARKRKSEYVLSLVIVDNKNKGTIEPGWAHITVDLPDGLEVTHYKVRTTGPVEPGTEPAWIPVRWKRAKA